MHLKGTYKGNFPEGIQKVFQISSLLIGTQLHLQLHGFHSRAGPTGGQQRHASLDKEVHSVIYFFILSIYSDRAPIDLRYIGCSVSRIDRPTEARIILSTGSCSKTKVQQSWDRSALGWETDFPLFKLSNKNSLSDSSQRDLISEDSQSRNKARGYIFQP